MNPRLVLLSVVVLLCGSVRAAEHAVDLTVHSVRGSIGWHFSIYIDRSNNFGGTHIKKIKFRDDDSTRMNPGETWHETYTVDGPATYVLDFSD
jgi:hypothetical protein